MQKSWGKLGEVAAILGRYSKQRSKSLGRNARCDGQPVGRVALGSHHVVLVRAGNCRPVLTAELRQKVTGGTPGRSLGLVLDGPKNHAARYRHGIKKKV